MDNPYLQYQQQRVQFASPGQRVVMRYDGALRFLRSARIAMDAGNVIGQSHHINKAQSVLLSLASSLNLDQRGELAVCLLRIYEYCYSRLCDAASADDSSAVLEVAALLTELRGAWLQAESQVGPLLAMHMARSSPDGGAPCWSAS